MKQDQELEQRLAKALDHAAPDDLDGVLSRCGERKGVIIPMKKKPSPRIWAAAAVAACLLLALGTGGAYTYRQQFAVASVVSLDVNPSIELRVNQKDRVLSCTPMNDDAVQVLAGMANGEDLKGTKLDVAVNAIVGSLVRCGYLDSIGSAILISVEDADQTRAIRLQEELVATVDGLLQGKTNILSQVVEYTPYASGANVTPSGGVSAGKSYLVQQVMDRCGIAGDEAFTRLAALSVEELNDMLKAKLTQIPIGKTEAWVAAEIYAGTMTLDFVSYDVDPELDETPPHYEVEIKTAFGEFEYGVDAFTGEILWGSPDVLGAAQTAPETPAQPDPASSDELCVLPTAPPTPMPAPAPTQAPTPTPTTAPVYTRHPEGDHHGNTHHSGTAAPSTDIGAAAAKAAALSHAGVAETDVRKLEVERDYENGRLVYEVEFKSGGFEYEYEIDAANGAILKYEREWDD